MYFRELNPSILFWLFAFFVVPERKIKNKIQQPDRNSFPPLSIFYCFSLLHFSPICCLSFLLAITLVSNSVIVGVMEEKIVYKSGVVIDCCCYTWSLRLLSEIIGYLLRQPLLFLRSCALQHGIYTEKRKNHIKKKEEAILSPVSVMIYPKENVNSSTTNFRKKY